MNGKADFLLNESTRIDSHNESNRFESRIGMLYWTPVLPRCQLAQEAQHRLILYIEWQLRNFVPYLCKLVSVAILLVKLVEMFVTLMTLIRFVGWLMIMWTFSSTKWLNFIWITWRIFNSQLHTLCQVIPTKWRSYSDHRFCDVISSFVLAAFLTHALVWCAHCRVYR